MQTRCQGFVTLNKGSAATWPSSSSLSGTMQQRPRSSITVQHILDRCDTPHPQHQHRLSRTNGDSMRQQRQQPLPAPQQSGKPVSLTGTAQVNAASASQQELLEWATAIRRAPQEVHTVKLLCWKNASAGRSAGQQRRSSKQQAVVQPAAYTSNQHRAVLAEASAKLLSDKLKHPVQEALSRVVSASALRHLELCVKLSNKLYEQLGTALAANSSLEVLSLAGSCCGDVALAGILPAVTQHPKLQVLELPGCCLTDTSAFRLATLMKAQGAAAAQQAWVTGLRGAGVQSSRKHGVAGAVGNGATDNAQGLRVLDISQNQITAAALPAVAAALADENSSLMHLSLAVNQLPAAETAAATFLQVISQDPPNRSFTVDLRGNSGSNLAVGAGADGAPTLPHLGVWAGMFTWDAAKLAPVGAHPKEQQQHGRRVGNSRPQAQLLNHIHGSEYGLATQDVSMQASEAAGSAVQEPAHASQDSSNEVQPQGNHMPVGIHVAENLTMQQQQGQQTAAQQLSSPSAQQQQPLQQQQTPQHTGPQPLAVGPCDGQPMASQPWSNSWCRHVNSLQQAAAQPEQAAPCQPSHSQAEHSTATSSLAGMNSPSNKVLQHPPGNRCHSAATATAATASHGSTFQQQGQKSSGSAAGSATATAAVCVHEQEGQSGWQCASSRQALGDPPMDQGLLQVIMQQQQMLEMLIQQQEVTQQQQRRHVAQVDECCDEGLLFQLAGVLGGLSEQVDALEQLYNSSTSPAQQPELTTAAAVATAHSGLQHGGHIVQHERPQQQQQQQQQRYVLVKALAVPEADASALISRAVDTTVKHSVVKPTAMLKASDWLLKGQPAMGSSGRVCNSHSSKVSLEPAASHKHAPAPAAAAAKAAETRQAVADVYRSVVDDISRQLYELHGLS